MLSTIAVVLLYEYVPALVVLRLLSNVLNVVNLLPGVRNSQIRKIRIPRQDFNWAVAHGIKTLSRFNL